MDCYQYSPIISAFGEIRLLTLIPGVTSDEIYLELRHEKLSDPTPPVFEALSYTWGSGWKRIRIKASRSEGESLLVTENLAVALKYLRYKDRPRVLWVDAICINQNDIQERSQQVAMMGDIYQLASRVVVWLGPEGDDSVLALDLLENIQFKTSMSGQLDTLKPPSVGMRELDWANQAQPLPYNRREFDAIYHLINRPWFERLWIRQEIHFAKPDAAVMCGTKVITWEAFRDAIFCIRLKQKNREMLASKTESFYERMELITQLCNSTAHLPLEYLLNQSRRSKCSDPRDRVYAMLYILHPSDKCLGIIPDYSKKTAVVYKNLVLKYVSRYNSLRILSCCEIRETTPPEMPSWVPNWSISNLCEPLWVCGQAGVLLSRAYVSFLGDETLRVAGIFCATINEVQDIIFTDNSDQEMIQKIRELAPPNIIEEDLRPNGRLLEVYCRTLCCDEFGDRWMPPRPHFPRIQNSIDNIATFLGIGRSHKESETQENNSAMYLSSVWKFCRGRSFFSTLDGQIGLGPKSTKVGDKLCTLFGRDTPLILRPIIQNAKIKYQVVGECYVHGLMAGEALLGGMPKHVEQVFQPDKVFYLDRKKHTIQIEDPRLGPFLSNMVNHGYIDEASVTALREKGILESLQKSGIDVKIFDLI